MPPDSPQDPSPTRHLLGRHHAGDPHALGELLARELPALRAEVSRRLHGVLRRRMDTNDMVQEVCLLVLRRGPRFVVRDPGSFRALMARIVRNALVSTFRHFGSSLRLESAAAPATCLDLDAASPTTTPGDKAERAENREIVRVALMLLEPVDGEVLRLRDEEEQPYAEIGRRLGLQEDAVRMRHRRALRKLEAVVLGLRNGQLPAVLADLERDAKQDPAPEG